MLTELHLIPRQIVYLLIHPYSIFPCIYVLKKHQLQSVIIFDLIQLTRTLKGEVLGLSAQTAQQTRKKLNSLGRNLLVSTQPQWISYSTLASKLIVFLNNNKGITIFFSLIRHPYPFQYSFFFFFWSRPFQYSCRTECSFQ